MSSANAENSSEGFTAPFGGRDPNLAATPVPTTDSVPRSNDLPETVVRNAAETVSRLSMLPSTLPSGPPGYEIVEELGRGGMGVVYKARQAALSRTVALKMLLGGQFAAPAAHARFLVEAEVVAQIKHPRIVTVFDYGQHHGQPFFALEYVNGGTLAERIAAGRFSSDEAAEMVLKLAHGIAAAHAKGIVHRDLKPANVLIDEHGEPKVSDFGLAKVGTSDVTASGAIIGTPNYMSPEQAAGRTREVGTPTDVYSLGAILYELLTGRTPFKGDSAMATI